MGLKLTRVVHGLTDHAGSPTGILLRVYGNRKEITYIIDEESLKYHIDGREELIRRQFDQMETDLVLSVLRDYQSDNTWAQYEYGNTVVLADAPVGGVSDG